MSSREERHRVVLLTVVGLAGLVLVFLLAPYRGYAGAEVIVNIPQGASASQVAALLGNAGLIRSPAMFRWVVRLRGSAGRLQAGEYRFAEPAGPLAVHGRLVRGGVLLHRITLPEGLRMEEIFDLLVDAGLGDREKLREAAVDPGLRELSGSGAPDLEGYLYPDTYQFPRALSARDTLRRMVLQFLQVVGPAERARAAELGLSVHELVTLASLVEEETGAPEERAMVASVFHNRLRRRMPLQCDPTVIYALIRAGDYGGRLTRRGLAVDSPYNTYLHRGLPPGPISSPGAESIRAVLQPAETGYLYFVSRNDGTHKFSARLQEHERAVDEYQRRRR